MKYVNKLLLSSLLILSAACAETALYDLPDEGSNGSAEETVDEGRRMVEVLIHNNLQTGQAQTKAPIASNAENEITSMDIYVFGSLTENGKYTYQERLSYRADEEVTKTDDVYPFVLVPSASNTAVSTARLSIKKGLYVKLYCVANQKELYTLDDTPSYVPATFTPLKQTKPGADGNAVETEGTPTETEFLTDYVTHVINPFDETDVMTTPLIMAGDIAGCIDLTDINENSRLNVSMKLTRAVARFDILNDQAKTRLEITSVGMVEGNATTSLFPFTGKGDAEGELITYPVRKFLEGTDNHDAINSAAGLASAYYSYAAPEKAQLQLDGVYTTVNGEKINVTYKVPFENIVDGNGTKVTINPNHRYTVKVNEVSAYEVKLSIEVTDWEEGGSLDDYQPDNSIHISAPTSIASNNQFSSDYIWAGVDQSSLGNEFIYNLESNSELTYELVYYNAQVSEGKGWLKITEATPQISVGAEWSHKYAYTIASQAPTEPSTSSYPTATIVFKNKTGSAVNLVVQPRPKIGSVFAVLVGDYWIGYTASANTAVNLTTAKNACTGDWHLPTMNEWREIIRTDDDWNHYLTPGTDAFYDFFEGADAVTAKEVDASVAVNMFGTGSVATGTGSAAALSVVNSYWSADASKKTPDNNLCLEIVNVNAKTARYSSKATAGANALVRCVMKRDR